MKNKILTLLIISLAILTSCDKGGEPDPGGTNTKDFAGDWFIDITDASGAIRHEHALHTTYNTAANDNTMWIDDWLTRKQLPDGSPPTSTNAPSGESLRSKITFDIATGTFSCINQPNLNDEGKGTVTITEGKIEKRGALSKAGNVVDKISFKAEFSYDPGKKYTFVGHKRTGFFEDEY